MRPMNVAQALQIIDNTVRQRLATEFEVEIEAIVDALNIDEDTADAVWEAIAPGDFLIGFEWGGPGISPMTNSFNALVDLMDLGGPTVFLRQPDDGFIGMPMVVFSEVPRDDRVAQFRALAELMVASRRRGEGPIGDWSPPDILYVASEFPRPILQACFVEMLEAFPSDQEGVIAILERKEALDGLVVGGMAPTPPGHS